MLLHSQVTGIRVVREYLQTLVDHLGIITKEMFSGPDKNSLLQVHKVTGQIRTSIHRCWSIGRVEEGKEFICDKARDVVDSQR